MLEIIKSLSKLLEKVNTTRSSVFSVHPSYELMCDCWRDSPNDRPTFHTTVQCLNSLLYPHGKRTSWKGNQEKKSKDTVYVNLFSNVQVPPTPSPEEQLKQPDFPMLQIHSES